MTCIVLHSTESDPGTCDAVARYLVRMGYEPHEVFDPSNGDGVLLLPKSEPGKALMNLPGGVETNRRGGVYQIEIVGRAVDVPNYDDAWHARLRKRLLEVCEFNGTPYVFPLPFQPYPQSYGRNLVRMTYDEWQVFEGVCGHQHVPENDHGDPGALDVSRLAAPSIPKASPTNMIRLLVSDDPEHAQLTLGVGTLAWISTGNVDDIFDIAQVPTVDVTVAMVHDLLLSHVGIGRAPNVGALKGAW